MNNMNMSKEEYGRFVAERMPPSPILRDCIFAFIIGGLICCIGQLIGDLWTMWGLEEKEAAAATTVSMVFLGVVSTALGLYARIAKYGGAGTLVPITGFANAVSSPAVEFKTEGFVLGVGAKMFTIAGPVIVYGISASVVYGLIYWLCLLF